MIGYEKLFGGRLYIGKNVKIEGGDDACGWAVGLACGQADGAVSVTFHLEMPQSVKMRILQEFGKVYREDPEGYAVIADENGINIYSFTSGGLLQGAYTLVRQSQKGTLPMGMWYSYPRCPFRGIKVFLPSRENMTFFKELIRFCSFYGCNHVMIETGGAMEYKRHPEINQGWEEYCGQFDEYQGKTIDVQNASGWKKNSIHYENGGGSWLTQEEVRELVDYCNWLHLEVIPEVPSLSHSDYLLTRHPEFAERKEDPLPDTYCPSNQAVYDLLFDVLEETLAVFRPQVVNIGHDEWYSIGLCQRCREEKAADLYAKDINRIYEFLRERGIKTMLWGDKLLNAVSYKGVHYGGSHIAYTTADGRKYCVPATYEAIENIPSDIVILNWYWRLCREYDKTFLDRGFPVLYGNFRPLQIFDIHERMDGKIDGWCISNWSSLDPAHIQRNGIYIAIAYAASLFWMPTLDETEFEKNFFKVAENIFRYHYTVERPGSYASVVHTTGQPRPHKEFVDGYLMDYKKDLLGEYTVQYRDGSKKVFPVWFGLNIGWNDALIGRKLAYDSDMYELTPYFYEPSYTCNYIRDGNKLYYRWMIPLEEGKEVENISLTAGVDQITVKEICYGNTVFTG